MAEVVAHTEHVRRFIDHNMQPYIDTYWIGCYGRRRRERHRQVPFNIPFFFAAQQVNVDSISITITSEWTLHKHFQWLAAMYRNFCRWLASVLIFMNHFVLFCFVLALQGNASTSAHEIKVPSPKKCCFFYSAYLIKYHNSDSLFSEL